jgi:hypothetical protein
MASFTETATLKVIDQSSAEIKAINAALRSLMKSAKQLKSVSANIDIKTKGLAQATSMMSKLTANAKGLKSVTVGVNTSAMSLAMQKLAALRSQASRPITVRTSVPQSPTPRLTTPPGQTRGGFGGGGGMVVHLAQSSISAIAHAVGHAVAHATKEGVNDSTMGESSLKLKQLDRITGPGSEAASRQAIRDLGTEKAGMTGGALLSAGQRAQLFSEALGVTNLNVESAKGLTSGMEELIRSGVVLGQSFDNAREGAINYGKAAEMMGRTTFHNAEEAAAVGKHVGDFDPEKTQRTFDYFQKIQPEIGKEMTGTFTKQIAKYLGSARFAMTDRAMGAVLLLGEEEGTRAAVGWRQATKQLSGQGLKKQQLKNQIEGGLVNTEEVKKESRSGKITFTTEAKGAKDREMLAKDLPKYVATYIAPLADKFKLDITKPEDAVALAQKVVSDTTAVETVAALLYRSNEIQKKLDTVDKREGGAEIVRRLTAQDVRATMTGLGNQLQSVTGEAVMAFAPAFTPVLNSMSEGMRQMGETIKAASAGDKEAQGKIATGALATAVLGAPAAKMAAQVAAPLAALATPLGMIAGMQAMTSSDPATRALGAAGESLIGAASALNSAASALMASALVGKDQGTMKQIMSTLEQIPGLGQALKVAHILYNAAEDLPAPEELTPSEKATGAAIRAQAQAKADQAKAEADRSMMQQAVESLKLEQSSAAQRLKQTKNPRQRAALESELTGRGNIITELTNGINSLTAQISQLAINQGKPMPDWMKQPPAVKPPPDGDKKWGDPGKPSSLSDIKPAAEGTPDQTSGFSATFLEATSQLKTTAAAFPEVFSTGAMTIGQSGQTVAAAISAGAASAGAAYGAAAAAQISAAVANVNINVNNNGGGGGSSDKGNINNANGNK